METTRDAYESDRGSMLHLARSTEVFSLEEMKCLEDDLDEYFLTDNSDNIYVYGEGRYIKGFAQFGGPLVITDRVWCLYWIVVGKEYQNTGVGKSLLRDMECKIKSKHGRMILIETSSTEIYLPTRMFYLRNGYNVDATIKHYYKKDDHKVIFSKFLCTE